MSMTFDEIEKEIKALTPKEKAALARSLIEELDSLADEDVEALWLEEAERRYAEYKSGKVFSRPAEDVMRNARHRIK
jgi:putative addiction module component (TIGR02574 family)